MVDKGMIGKWIAEYPDDGPFSSVLLLGYCGEPPVHAVVAREIETGNCHLITIYWPDPVSGCQKRTVMIERR